MPEAAFNLGLLTDVGIAGHPPNPSAAFHWYSLAAEGGLTAGAFNAGVMLDAGRGTARDPATAATFYGRAAAAGHRRAAFNLGQLYRSGEGVPRNPAVAAAWFAVAAGTPAPRVSTAGELHPPTPSWPLGLVSASGTPPGVALVWQAAPLPAAAITFVEIVEVDTDGPRPRWSGTSDVSAVLAPVSEPGDYAWRVTVAMPALGHYVAGSWTRFTLALPHPPAPEPLLADETRSVR